MLLNENTQQCKTHLYRYPCTYFNTVDLSLIFQQYVNDLCKTFTICNKHLEKYDVKYITTTTTVKYTQATAQMCE